MKIRVLEYGENVAAAYCGRLYAQWGAEVIRIDAPQTSASDPAGAPAMALDTYLHAGKRRLGLDVTEPEGRAVLDQLATHCDLLVTDVSPASLDHLDWLSLGDARKPSIKVSITPFGLHGPYRDWQAHGAIVLAMGGYTTLMGDPGRAPLTLPGQYVEYQAGQYAYLASLATLLQQQKEEAMAPGHIIEVSLLETVLSLSQFTTVMWTFQGQIRSRHGNDWQTTHPMTLYPCKDGWFAVSVVPPFWDAFTRMLDRPELRDDPRFATSDQRIMHRVELDAIVLETLGHLTMQELLALGQRQCRVPTGILSNVAQLLDDSHLHARFYWQMVVDGSGREWQSAGAAFRYCELGPQPVLAVAEPGQEDATETLKEWTHG
jgi:crotonobetainyl-CoA:carnitine CoA-transferase CaiB-like acyl-CoA transferase